MRDICQVYHSQHAQPPIARCGPARISHWRFRVQIIKKIYKNQNHFALCLQYKWYGNKSDMYSLTCRASKSFDSQSEAESLNTKNFGGGLEYSLHSFPQQHTTHLPDCLHWSTRSPEKCAKPHEAIKLQFLTSMETQDSPVTYVIYKYSGIPISRTLGFPNLTLSWTKPCFPWICFTQALQFYLKTNPALIWKAKGYNAFYEKILVRVNSKHVSAYFLRNLIPGRAHLL